MAVTVYRLCRRIYASLDGEGASGWPLEFSRPAGVYMAQSLALAVVENLVHVSRQDYPTRYVVVMATVPDTVRIIGHLRYFDSESCEAAVERTARDQWLQSGESAVLRVPTAVVAGDWNYVINPRHLEFAQIWIAPPMPFQFDERSFELKWRRTKNHLDLVVPANFPLTVCPGTPYLGSFTSVRQISRSREYSRVAT